MTTRGYEVNLDRLLTREITVPGPPLVGVTYRYDSKVTALTENITPTLSGQGSWAGIGTSLWLFETDADGADVPEGDSITLDSTSMVVITGVGGYTFSTVLVAYVVASNPVTFHPLPDTRMLTLQNFPHPEIPDGPITVTLPTGGLGPDVTVQQEVWCGLRDFTGRDQINIGDGLVITLGDTRVLVRADESWDVGDIFTLEGQRLTVRGIARVGGRKQYLELLSRG